MSEVDRKSPAVKAKTAALRAAREARLAEEMRANLIKRKAQRRALERGEADATGPRDDQSSWFSGSGSSRKR